MTLDHVSEGDTLEVKSVRHTNHHYECDLSQDRIGETITVDSVENFIVVDRDSGLGWHQDDLRPTQNSVTCELTVRSL